MEILSKGIQGIDVDGELPCPGYSVTTPLILSIEKCSCQSSQRLHGSVSDETDDDAAEAELDETKRYIIQQDIIRQD